jgi:hypothetical protein
MLTFKQRLMSQLQGMLDQLHDSADDIFVDRCEVKQCWYPVDCRKLCKKHYRQWRRDECKRLGVARLKDAPAPAPLDDTLPLPFPTLPESSSLEEEVAF